MFEVFIIVIFFLFIINSIILAIYCRIEEKIDLKQEKKRQEIHLMSNEKKNESEANNTLKKSMIKIILAKMYSFLNPYFYGWMRYNIILTGKLPSTRIRNVLYRLVFNMKITHKTVIYGGCEFRSPWNIKADNCVIASNCIFDARRGIIIGDNVVFGGGVHIWTEEHDVNDPYFAVNFQNAQSVIIEDYAWICSDSTLLPGVHIGKGAVVASRATITKDCDDYGVYVGIPGRKIKEREKNLKYVLSGKPVWKFY